MFPLVSVWVQHREPGNLHPYNFKTASKLYCTFAAKTLFFFSFGNLQGLHTALPAPLKVFFLFFFSFPSFGHTLISNFTLHKLPAKLCWQFVRMKEGMTTYKKGSVEPTKSHLWCYYQVINTVLISNIIHKKLSTPAGSFVCMKR